MTDRQHFHGLQPEAVKAALIHIVIEHSKEHHMKLDVAEIDQIAYEVAGLKAIKEVCLDIVDTISDVVSRDISGWRNKPKKEYIATECGEDVSKEILNILPEKYYLTTITHQTGTGLPQVSPLYAMHQELGFFMFTKDFKMIPLGTAHTEEDIYFTSPIKPTYGKHITNETFFEYFKPATLKVKEVTE